MRSWAIAALVSAFVGVAQGQEQPAPPEEVAGFRLSWTLSEAAARCRTAGHEWLVREGDGYCEHPLAPVGFDAIVRVRETAGATLRLSLTSYRLSDVQLLSAWRNTVRALERRYGAPRTLHTGPEWCFSALERDDSLACFALGQARLALVWAVGEWEIFAVLEQRPGGHPIGAIQLIYRRTSAEDSAPEPSL